MNRKLKPTKSAQQIKKEQISSLVEYTERDIAEYKIIIKTKDKQLIEIKKILQGAKNSYQDLTKENKQLRQYIANIRQQKQQQQQQNFRTKNVVYEETTDAEPKPEQEETTEIEEIEEQDKQQEQEQEQEQKQQTNKRKIKAFDYLNKKDAKKNRK